MKCYFEEFFADEVNTHFMKDNYIENHYFLELNSPKVNKREGLIRWCKLVGCEPEEVTVFGDNLNDIGLFAMSGVKIAVSNANIALRAEADKVINSNEEDGVANYIEMIMR